MNLSKCKKCASHSESKESMRVVFIGHNAQGQCCRHFCKKFMTCCSKVKDCEAMPIPKPETEQEQERRTNGNVLAKMIGRPDLVQGAP